MPTYDYRCTACGAHFEVFLLPREKDTEVQCASCGSSEVSRQISTPQVLYKGSGYYTTDSTSAAPSESTPQDHCGGDCSCH